MGCRGTRKSIAEESARSAAAESAWHGARKTDRAMGRDRCTRAGVRHLLGAQRPGVDRDRRRSARQLNDGVARSRRHGTLVGRGGKDGRHSEDRECEKHKRGYTRDVSSVSTRS